MKTILLSTRLRLFPETDPPQGFPAAVLVYTPTHLGVCR